MNALHLGFRFASCADVPEERVCGRLHGLQPRAIMQRTQMITQQRTAV